MRPDAATTGSAFHPRVLLFTAIAMLAFAANSWLGRYALTSTSLDPASYTAIRLISGAVVLALLIMSRRRDANATGNWPSALALFGYAACFSFAYLSLTAATGALILFGAVQATMIGAGLAAGERINLRQLLGGLAALFGFVWLLVPGLEAPPLRGTLLMLVSGVAWGVYSLRGRESGDPTRNTAGNFARAAALGVLLGVVMLLSGHLSIDLRGVGYSVASGGITSGLGYAIWYAALPGLQATSAATVQLTVPAITAAGGVLLLGEPMTERLWLASVLILGGVAVFIRNGPRVAAGHPPGATRYHAAGRSGKFT